MTALTDNSRPSEIEIPDEFYTEEQEKQLWSALTLGSLQKNLTGHEDSEGFQDAKELVDNIAKSFANSDPIDIANYFEAIQKVSQLNGTQNRLDEVEDPFN